jgi:uncharacterized protein YraI
MISKRTSAALTVCAAAGWLMVACLPATAAPTNTAGAPDPALGCTYQVVNTKPDQYVDIRSGAGSQFNPVAKLRVADGRFAGACASVNGWVAVKAAGGQRGWASAHHLHKVRKARHAAGSGHGALACTYRVTHVRRAGFLNVRSGAGTRFHRVGKLRVADGRFAGACTSVNGWVAVKAGNGRRGWASAHYLHKVTTK